MHDRRSAASSSRTDRGVAIAGRVDRLRFSSVPKRKPPFPFLGFGGFVFCTFGNRFVRFQFAVSFRSPTTFGDGSQYTFAE
jgi:hypothetical protein